MKPGSMSGAGMMNTGGMSGMSGMMPTGSMSGAGMMSGGAPCMDQTCKQAQDLLRDSTCKYDMGQHLINNGRMQGMVRCPKGEQKCQTTKYDNTGGWNGHKESCVKKGSRCPCDTKWENECNSGMGNKSWDYWCQGNSMPCPVHCKAPEKKCVSFTYDQTGFPVGMPNETCVKAASQCKCGAGSLKTACLEGTDANTMAMMTMGKPGMDMSFYECKSAKYHTSCPVTCTGKEVFCYSTSFDNMGMPLGAQNTSCVTSAAQCKCGAGALSNGCLEGAGYGMPGFYDCKSSKIYDSCPVECKRREKECYGSTYDGNGTMIGSKKTCAKKGKECGCNAKWENQCLDPMTKTSWCQEKNYPCPVNCGRDPTCFSFEYNVNGTAFVQDKFGMQKMKEFCGKKGKPCPCSKHEIKCIEKMGRRSFSSCLPKMWNGGVDAKCPVNCANNGSTTCFLSGFNAKGEFDFNADTQVCRPKQKDCAGLCGKGGKWCGPQNYMGWCIWDKDPVGCPVQCTTKQRECFIDNFDKTGGWESTTKSCVDKKQKCPACSATATECVDKNNKWMPSYCIPKSEKCPVMCDFRKEKMCFAMNFKADGTEDMTSAATESCVSKRGKCGCGKNALACSQFDTWANQSFEYCLPTVTDGVKNSCPVTCKKNQVTCQIQNFNRTGGMTDYTEMCTSRGGKCPCGFNSTKCTYRRASWCQPTWDVTTNTKSSCPVSCNSTQKKCYVPAYDGSQNYLKSVEYCETKGTACDCTKGSGSKTCTVTRGGRNYSDCIGPGDYCPVTCAGGQHVCPQKDNYGKGGDWLSSAAPSTDEQCASSLGECKCGTNSQMCTARKTSWCQASAYPCPVICTSKEKMCTVTNYDVNGSVVSYKDQCMAGNATCPCGANNAKCVIGGRAMCFPSSMKAAVCPCKVSQDVCYVDDFDLNGLFTGTRAACAAKGTACPCGKNTNSCSDTQDAKRKICLPKFSKEVSGCPTPCTPTAEKAGNATCIRKNLDSSGKPTSEEVTCVKKGSCEPGRGQKTCPTGATISSAYSCKDLYGLTVVAKNSTNTTNASSGGRRLVQSSVSSGDKQTASVTFTLKDLKGTSKDAPTAKVKIDSILQLQSELQATLSMVVSGKEASMIYKITNLGISQVAPSQVAEKFRGFLNAGDPSTKSALAPLGTVKLGAKGCCTLSTDVKTVVDKTPTTTTTTTTTTTSTTTTSTTTTSTTTTLTTVAKDTTVAKATTVITTTVKAPTVVVGKVVFDVDLPANLTAANFVKDPKVKKGVEKGIATRLNVSADWVKATLTIATGRRLSSSRLLAKASINVDFKITIPPTASASQSESKLQTSIKSATTAAWSTGLQTSIKAEDAATFKDLKVTVSSVAHVTTTTTTAKPTTSTEPADSLGEGSANGANDVSRSSMVVPLVTAAVLASSLLTAQ